MNKTDMLCGPARFCMSCGGKLAPRKKHGRTRRVCTRCGRVYFRNPSSASAVAIVSNGTVVLVKRSVPPAAGSWCLPAGFQEYNESPEETAVREAKEETNLDVRLLGLYKVYFSKAFPGKNTVVHLYLAEAVGGVMSPGDDACEVRAFPLGRLPVRIAFKAQLDVIEALKKGIPPLLPAGRGRRRERKPRRRAGRKKLNVAVIMGGRTAEHDISISTGTIIVSHLDRKKYNVKPVIINRSGLWHVPIGYPGGDAGAFREKTRGEERDFVPIGEAITRLLDDRVDLVFIAMHGPHGEDGTIQGMMELLDLPYTGSDVCASALAMDKVKTKEIYRHHGIPTPKYVVCQASRWELSKKDITSVVKETIGYPCVLKPARLGSSVGSSICTRQSKLAEMLDASFKYDSRILIEQFIGGREFTCAVLDTPGGKPPVALPPTEIVPRSSSYFDYFAKYTPGATEEITPAPIGKGLTRRIQELAIRSHEALGCYAKSRTDMLLKGRKLYVLETNTIPGMTKTSLLPQAAEAYGLSFPRLLDRIIALALEAHRRKRRHGRTS